MTIIATFHSKRGLQEAVLRLLGPAPHCDHRDEDGVCFHRYPFTHVWIVIGSDGVYLRARSEQSSLIVSVRVAIAFAGEGVTSEFMVKSDLLANAVLALPHEAIALTFEEYVSPSGYTIPFLRFTGMPGSLTLPVEQTTCAAPPPLVCNPEKLSVTAAAWHRLHQHVFSAHGPGKANVKNEATHGVRVEVGPGVKMIATDGHRIHVDSCEAESLIVEHSMMLLPSDFCEAVDRLLTHHTASSTGAKLAIDYRADDVVAQVEGDQVYRERKAGLIFPPYQELIDKIEPRISATLRTSLILSYLARLTMHRTNATVALILTGDRLTCRSDWSTTVDFDGPGPSLTLDDAFSVQYEGPPRKAKLDARYLYEVLRMCGEQATLALGWDHHDAAVIGGDRFSAVVMPTKCDMTDPEFVDP